MATEVCPHGHKYLLLTGRLLKHYLSEHPEHTGMKLVYCLRCFAVKPAENQHKTEE